MGEKAKFKMESEREIRNGFMNLVVSVANQLVKRTTEVPKAVDAAADAEKKEDSTVINYLDGVGEEWRAFVDGQLKLSNDNNNKTLGGSTTNKSEPEDQDDSNYDVQMEKIMARFTNFNQILSQGNTVDDDDDDDDDDEGTKDDDSEEKKSDAKKETFDEDTGTERDRS